VPLSDLNQSFKRERSQKTRLWRYKNDPIGHSVQGQIVDGGKMPDRDFITKEINRWPNGDEKLNDFLVIQTTLNQGPDEDGNPDDGKRMIVLSGQPWTAAKDALIAAGCLERGFEEGGTFGIQYYADGQPEGGKSPAKLHRAFYQPPAVVPGSNFGPQPQAQPAPAPTPAPQQAIPTTPQPGMPPQPTPPPQAPWPSQPAAAPAQSPEAPQVPPPAPWPTS
jgi:hypothetical protein